MSFSGLNENELVQLAIKDGTPTVFQGKHFVEGDGLMAYHPNPDELFKTAGRLVVRILKGTRPGDLPVEQPIKFELAINLRTAKALRLTIPPSLLARADQVIE
jgi:putative tryptophan/tyrosine transport system substrate-binding protein